MSAHDYIAEVVDPGSFVSWDEPAPEAVLTGRARVHGHEIAVVVGEFGFLGGSIGRATVDRIVGALRRARLEGLPVLAAPASGGTRMQEGTPAFLQMAEISRALMAHRGAGLPYLVHLRHPTTGGVYASWGSLGHVTVAEPGALVGFLGPKVFEALNGRPFPAGVQEAENLAAKGVIDAVVPAEELPELVDRALGVLVDPPEPATLPRRDPVAPGTTRDHPVWDDIEATRGERAGVRELLRYGASGTLRLRGTDEGERDDSVLIALTRLDGQPCVLVGQDRARQSPSQPMGPGGLREARRGMALAQELGLALVTVVDTPGAELSPKAEEGAIAGEIARCIATLVSLSVPTVSVILGEGCGGGALALLPARTVLAAERGWLSPLPPEGASVIVHGDPTHAPEMARRQRVGAADLCADGLVDHVVAEPPGATRAELARAVAATVVDRLPAYATGAATRRAS